MAKKSLSLFSYSGLSYAAMKAASLLLALLLLGCGAPLPQHDSTFIAKRSGVVFLGDSIFARWNLAQSFPGKSYVDAGIAGQTTAQILERVPDTLSGQNVCSGDAGVINCQTIAPPQTVVIYAGWNDLFHGLNPDLAAFNIEQMIVLSMKAGAHPVIATVYHYDPAYSGGSQFDGPADKIDAGILSVASRYGVPVVDLEQLFAFQSDYTLDGVHPNQSGYVQMHDVIAPALN